MGCDFSVLPLAVVLTIIIFGAIGIGLWSFFIMVGSIINLVVLTKNHLTGNVERIYPDRIPRNETRE